MARTSIRSRSTLNADSNSGKPCCISGLSIAQVSLGHIMSLRNIQLPASAKTMTKV